MSKSLNRFYITIASVVFLGLLVAANEGTAAGQTGTPEEAKAMLERAVAALKADQPAALKAFTAGTEGFKDRDLYVFCGDAAGGLITAHGANSALIGQSMRDIKDKAGKAIGEEFYAVATEGKFNAVEYVWPRPGETEPVQKASYVTKVADQVCGVGYYK
jgi:signal transduction histidine kinase